MSTDTPLLMALATRLVICALQARDLPNLESDEHFGRDASDPYLGIFVGDGAEHGANRNSGAFVKACG